MHGLKGGMTHCQAEMKKAVEAGYWEMFRYNPAAEKKLVIDSKAPTGSYQDFIKGETRYARLAQQNPERAAALFDHAEKVAAERYHKLTKLEKLYGEE